MRLQHSIRVNWKEFDDATTAIEWDGLQNKYSNHPKKIRIQIASRLRHKRDPKIVSPQIHKIIGGKPNTVGR